MATVEKTRKRKNPDQTGSIARAENATNKLQETVLDAIQRKQLKNATTRLEHLTQTPNSRAVRRQIAAYVPRVRQRGRTGRSSLQRYQMVMPPAGKRTQCTATVAPHKEMPHRCRRMSALGDRFCAGHGGFPRALRGHTHGKLVPLLPENGPVLVCDM